MLVEAKALLVARLMRKATEMPLKSVIGRLRPLREFVGEIAGHERLCSPDVPLQVSELGHDFFIDGAMPRCRL